KLGGLRQADATLVGRRPHRHGELAEVEAERGLDPVRARVVLEVAEDHVGELDVVHLEGLAFDGVDRRELDLEALAARRIAEQRREPGERMDIDRERRERGPAGGAASRTPGRPRVLRAPVEAVDREPALETLEGRVARDAVDLEEVL